MIIASWESYKVDYPGHREQRKVDTVRILAQAQEDISSTNVSLFFECYYGPADAAYWMLSLYSVQYEILLAENEGEIYPPLGSALRAFGRGEDQTGWETFIRRLISIGINIHARVPRGRCFDPYQYPYPLSPYGTPLDELFTNTGTAVEAKSAGDAWLQILSTEGYDVLAYLEHEEALHATQPPITCPSICYLSDMRDVPRQLVFDLGENPTVYAEPWMDPESSIFLVHQAFKDTNIFANSYSHRGKGSWPITYPKWYSCWPDPDEDAPANERRADRRRQKKAMKAARRNRKQNPARMPGAWPGE